MVDAPPAHRGSVFFVGQAVLEVEQEYRRGLPWFLRRKREYALVVGDCRTDGGRLVVAYGSANETTRVIVSE